LNSTVCVYDKNGHPVKNKKVSISISGIISGGMAEGFTDRNGCAEISHSSKGTAKVFVNGHHVCTFTVPGRTSVTI
jgi:hypothetical protein